MDTSQYIGIPAVSKRLGISRNSVRKRIKSMGIAKLNPIPNVAVIHIDDFCKIQEAVKLRRELSHKDVLPIE